MAVRKVVKDMSLSVQKKAKGGGLLGPERRWQKNHVFLHDPWKRCALTRVSFPLNPRSADREHIAIHRVHAWGYRLPAAKKRRFFHKLNVEQNGAGGAGLQYDAAAGK
jgi:hypothetical protein